MQHGIPQTRILALPSVFTKRFLTAIFLINTPTPPILWHTMKALRKKYGNEQLWSLSVYEKAFLLLTLILLTTGISVTAKLIWFVSLLGREVKCRVFSALVTVRFREVFIFYLHAYCITWHCDCQRRRKNMDCFDFNVPETLNNILRTIFWTGTITGLGRRLKELNPNIIVVGKKLKFL